MGGSDGHLLDNRQPEAGRRLAALSALFDESTFRHLHHLGLGPGWQVWEVGARRLSADYGTPTINDY